MSTEPTHKKFKMPEVPTTLSMGLACQERTVVGSSAVADAASISSALTKVAALSYPRKLEPERVTALTKPTKPAITPEDIEKFNRLKDGSFDSSTFPELDSIVEEHPNVLDDLSFDELIRLAYFYSKGKKHQPSLCRILDAVITNSSMLESHALIYLYNLAHFYYLGKINNSFVFKALQSIENPIDLMKEPFGLLQQLFWYFHAVNKYLSLPLLIAIDAKIQKDPTLVNRFAFGALWDLAWCYGRFKKFNAVVCNALDKQINDYFSESRDLSKFKKPYLYSYMGQQHSAPSTLVNLAIFYQSGKVFNVTLCTILDEWINPGVLKGLSFNDLIKLAFFYQSGKACSAVLCDALNEQLVALYNRMVVLEKTPLPFQFVDLKALAIFYFDSGKSSEPLRNALNAIIEKMNSDILLSLPLEDLIKLVIFSWDGRGFNSKLRDAFNAKMTSDELDETPFDSLVQLASDCRLDERFQTFPILCAAITKFMTISELDSLTFGELLMLIEVYSYNNTPNLMLCEQLPLHADQEDFDTTSLEGLLELVTFYLSSGKSDKMICDALDTNINPDVLGPLSFEDLQKLSNFYSIAGRSNPVLMETLKAKK